MSEEELNRMSNNELIGIIKSQRFEIKQLENIRKETIKYVDENVAVYAFNNKKLPHWEFNDENIIDLLNILNKGE